MEINIQRKEAIEAIKTVRNLKDLDAVFKRYLGKKGEIALVLAGLAELTGEQKKVIGQKANQFKREITEAINGKKAELKELALVESDDMEWLDITAPGKKMSLGHLHPLTLAQRKASEIFQQMGFEVVDGPEVESEWYNFDALNVPKDHPARDMWDTFWLRQKKLLLRTHTSPVQIRYMEKRQPPLRIIAPGRVFRYEATDASHEINFYQIEGLMVGDDISAANFKAIIQEFLRRFFNKPVSVRLGPSYFPFVEPGFEIDMSCVVCAGKGCSLCSRTGWLEVAGAGMVNQAVFKAVGFKPREYQGFAFGMGLDRLAMMKYKINDIRLFYTGDLRFLKQF